MARCEAGTPLFRRPGVATGALAWSKGEGMLRRGVCGGFAEGQREGGAFVPGWPLVHEPGAGWVAGLAEDDIESGVIEIGEVGGEALGGAEGAANLLDSGGVAALRLGSGSSGHADETLEQ